MNGRDTTSRAARASGAMVLLEVVLAIALFSLSAGVILGGFRACFRAANDMVISAQAADLAVSKMSELQMNPAAAASDGPNPYADDDSLVDWTWQVVVTPVENTISSTQGMRLQSVAVIICNPSRGVTCQVVELLPGGNAGESFARRPGGAGGRP